MKTKPPSAIFPARIPPTRAQLASEERYQAFVQNSHEGIWCCELRKSMPTDLSVAKQIAHIFEYGYLAEANTAMAHMYGLQSAEDLSGTSLREILVPSDKRNVAYLTEFIQSGYSLSGVESHEIDAEGNEKVFRNSLVGVIEDGRILRAWGTQQDVTEQYHALQAMRASEERLAMALKASHMGMWEWDIPANRFVWSDEMKALFGLHHDESITYEMYIGMIHPDEQESIRGILDKAREQGGEFRIERRIVWADGSVHWLLGQGMSFLRNGKPYRIIGTCLNIDDSKRAEELRNANMALKVEQDQLMALSASKDEFISLASHQLRTPATVVKQYVGMVLEGYRGPVDPQQEAFLRVAYENNDRQLQIINDLLQVARVDAGKVELRKEATDMVLLVNQVVEEHIATFTAGGQKLVFHKPATKIQAQVDVQRLRMVLDNIIENAYKYSTSGATTTIRLGGNNQRLTIAVHDQGIGIAKKDITKLFQKFSRIENDVSLQVGGTGIGLYWAQKIIDLHDGAIGVTSRLGKGSTFTINLPKH